MAINTTSSSNTPQAGDDLYLSSSTGLTEDTISSLGVVYLDVMSNDLGGKAKILYSIDDGGAGTLGDLVTKDTTTSPPEYSANGAKIAIAQDPSDGKIKIAYDASTLSAAFKDQLNALSDGDYLTDTFTYAIRLANGTLSWAAVTVQIAGVDDAAVVTVENVTDTEADSTDEETFDIAEKVSQTDDDAEDVVQVDYVANSGSIDNGVGANGATPPAPGPGTISLDEATGVVTYDRAAFNFLDDGQSVTYTITFNTKSGDDPEQTHTITVTINGENDEATITVEDPADVNESNTSVLVEFNVADQVTIEDVDSEDAADPTAYVANSGEVVANGPTPPAGTLDDLFAFDAATGAVSFDRGDFNWLNADQSVTYTITFDAQSGDDAVQEKSITVTINGENDAPVISIVTTDSISAALTETNAGLSTSDTLTVNDVDTADTVSSEVTGVVASGATGGLSLTNAQLLAMLSVMPDLGLAADTGDANNLTWTFNSGTQAFDYLNSGQSLVLTYTVEVDDGNSGTDTQTVTVTINGTADGDPNDFDAQATGAAGGITVTGSSGAQTLRGGSGDDIISGGSGADTIYGGAGNDTVYGFDATSETTAADPDLIYGGSGNDQIFGNQKNDNIYGGSGNDTMTGGKGSDTLTGGLGADVFRWGAGDEVPVPVGDGVPTDTVTDLDWTLGAGGAITGGADVLDLKDLLVGESNATLNNFLDFSRSGSNTIISVKTDGTAPADQAIILQGVDLTMGSTLTDAQIITNLINSGKLITDA